MKKVFKGIFWTLLVLFILIQFYPKAEKNISESTAANHINSIYPIPEDVEAVLKTSCYDCHSNHTVYPWYSKIQPVSWWLDEHIKDAKKELNFSEFATYSLRRQYHKLEEVNEQLDENEMPLQSYTILHNDAKLSTSQKALLSAWAENTRDVMKNMYPLDSLIKKKK